MEYLMQLIMKPVLSYLHVDVDDEKKCTWFIIWSYDII